MAALTKLYGAFFDYWMRFCELRGVRYIDLPPQESSSYSQIHRLTSEGERMYLSSAVHEIVAARLAKQVSVTFYRCKKGYLFATCGGLHLALMLISLSIMGSQPRTAVACAILTVVSGSYHSLRLKRAWDKDEVLLFDRATQKIRNKLGVGCDEVGDTGKGEAPD